MKNLYLILVTSYELLREQIVKSNYEIRSYKISYNYVKTVYISTNKIEMFRSGIESKGLFSLRLKKMLLQ